MGMLYIFKRIKRTVSISKNCVNDIGQVMGKPECILRIVRTLTGKFFA